MPRSSWLRLDAQDPAFALPADLRARDAFAGRDIGWIEQMRPFIGEFSRPGERVLDPFAGLGTTLLAAALERRRGEGWELDPQRVVLARERLQRHGIGDAVLTEGSIERPHAGAAPDVGLVLTNVPYFAARSGLATQTHAQQLYGSASYAEHLRMLGECFHRARERLRPGGYCIAMAQNLRIGALMLPLAWDLARVLASLFELCDERVLLYPSRKLRGGDDPGTSDRSHEYALVLRKHSEPVDAESAVQLLRNLHDAGLDFAMHGSFATWWRNGGTGTAPGDIDLLFAPVGDDLARALAWLDATGFVLSHWGEPLTLPFAPALHPSRYAVRAERVDRNGGRLRIDLGFALDGVDIAAVLRRAEWARGLRVVRANDVPGKP